MTDVGVDLDDTDSLFGSPPSSPRQVRGRSPSLALPGSPSASSAVPKNVGTIALPGSLTSSEPLVNLPASPPRPQITRAQPSRPLYALSQARANANEDRATSVAAAPRAHSKPSKRKAKSTTPAPTPNGPSLSLPDTSGPLPPNFLRSQQALLGLAGVVAGINPSQLNTRSSRGTSAHNPIVVEDEAPSISKSAWKARQSQLPSNLPVPNEQSIVDTLVAQQNIFPVLRSLLPYFGCSAEVGCCSGAHIPLYQNGHPLPHGGEKEAPPVKKRKINSVPAGAGDWDVPYPFQGDEGPRDYRQTWEKEREKKLVKELISLIREAVQKAAAKSYVGETEGEKSAKKSKPDYKPGVYYKSQLKDSETASSDSQDASQALLQWHSTQTAIGSEPPPSVSGSEWNSTFSTELETLLASLTADETRTFQNDLPVITSMDLSPTISNSPTLTSSTRLSTPFDLTRTTAGDKENAPSINDNSTPSVQTVDADLGFDFGGFDLSDIPIDPALLDLTSDLLPPTDSLSLNSEIASNSMDALTVVSVPPDGQGGQVLDTNSSSGWWQDFLKYVNDIPICSPPIDDAVQCLSSAVVDPSSIVSTQSSISLPSLSPVIISPSIPIPHAPSSSSSKPIASDGRRSPPIPPPMTTKRVSHDDGVTTRPTRGIMFMPPVTGAPIKKTLDRDEVLQKAKARREQLAAELARTKIELWETTIEQGVLLNLLKDDQLV